MSKSTRKSAVGGSRVFPRRITPRRASPRSWTGFSEDAGLQPSQFKLLIDENLSPRLGRFARRRGFPAAHVNDVKLRTAPDKHIARFAVDNGMILVTNNVRDFKRLYSRRKLHPGLIFLYCAANEALAELNQAALLGAALDDILRSDLVQESILVTLTGHTGASLHWHLTREMFPSI